MAGRGSIAGYPKSSLDIGVQCPHLRVSGRARHCSHGTPPVSSLPGNKPSRAGWVSMKRTPGTQPSAHHKNSAASPFTLLLGRASNHRFHLPTLSGMEKHIGPLSGPLRALLTWVVYRETNPLPAHFYKEMCSLTSQPFDSLKVGAREESPNQS